MAARLGLPLQTVACHDDLTASDLTGRFLLQGGETVWSDGPLTRAVREGGLCYLDEVVEARKDVTVVMHPLTDDRRVLPLERTGELLEAPDDFMLVASYNPGYQHVLKALKPSTRQRFIALELGFPPPEQELKILVRESGLPRERATALVNLANRLRELKGQDLEEGVSTRLLVYCGRLIQAGMPILQSARASLVEPLSDDEDVRGWADGNHQRHIRRLTEGGYATDLRSRGNRGPVLAPLGLKSRQLSPLPRSRRTT